MSPEVRPLPLPMMLFGPRIDRRTIADLGTDVEDALTPRAHLSALDRCRRKCAIRPGRRPINFTADNSWSLASSDTSTAPYLSGVTGNGIAKARRWHPASCCKVPTRQVEMLWRTTVMTKTRSEGARLKLWLSAKFCAIKRNGAPPALCRHASGAAAARRSSVRKTATRKPLATHARINPSPTGDIFRRSDWQHLGPPVAVCLAETQSGTEFLGTASLRYTAAMPR